MATVLKGLSKTKQLRFATPKKEVCFQLLWKGVDPSKFDAICTKEHRAAYLEKVRQDDALAAEVSSDAAALAAEASSSDAAPKDDALAAGKANKKRQNSDDYNATTDEDVRRSPRVARSNAALDGAAFDGAASRDAEFISALDPVRRSV